MERRVGKTQIAAFQETLCCEKCGAGTVEVYLREIHHFVDWLAGREVTKTRVIE